jgi:hypothetical protein
MFGKIMGFCIFPWICIIILTFPKSNHQIMKIHHQNKFWLGRGVWSTIFTKLCCFYFYKGNKGKVYLHKIIINNI